MILFHELFKVKGNSEIIATSGKETQVLKLVAELGLDTPHLYLFFYNSKMDKTGLSDLALKKIHLGPMSSLCLNCPSLHPEGMLLSF